MTFADKLKEAVEKKEMYSIVKNDNDGLWWIVNDLNIQIYSATEPWMLHEQLNKLIEFSKLSEEW